MKKPEPYEVHAEVGVLSFDQRQLATSLVLHAILVLAVLSWSGGQESEGTVEPADDRQIVALDPAVEFRQDPEPQQQVPEAPPEIPDDPIPLGPDSERPDDPPQDPVEEAVDDPVVMQQPAESPPAPDESESEQMERIPSPEDVQNNLSILGAPTSPFASIDRSAEGPPPQGSSAEAQVGPMGRTGFSKSDNRGWRQTSPQTGAGQCVEIPDFGVNADGSPVLASLIGVVRGQSGQPLPSAHLQIVGAPFATFADGAGNYRLEFDPKLLAKCRTQVVRVSAPGYRDETLNLAIGRRIKSDDVVMRRR